MPESQQPYASPSVPPVHSYSESAYGDLTSPDAGSQFPPSAPPAKRGNGLGVAALIVGIAALIGAVIPLINFVSGFLAFAGIVLGIIALVLKNRPKKLALTGLLVSVVALILSIVLAIVYTAGFVSAVDEASETKFDLAQEQDAVGSAPTPQVDPSAPVGSRENPAPIGTTVEMSDGGVPNYQITLGTPILDASAEVAAANEVNEPAPEGMQYALLPVTVTYVGTATGTPWIDLNIAYVSSVGTTHDEADSMIVGPSPSFMEINELYPGASGSGNVVVAIPAAAPANGTWTVEPLFLGDTFFFAAQ